LMMMIEPGQRSDGKPTECKRSAVTEYAYLGS
jgi:hypothetical protein